MTRCLTKSALDIQQNILIKPWSILLLGFLFLVSCSKIKDPEFIRLSEIKVEDLNLETVTLSCNALYNNPNRVGGELVSSDIEVFINDIKATDIKQEIHTKIPGNDEFTLPLTIKVPVKSLYKQKGNLLDNVLQTISTKTIKVKYKGEAKLKFAKIPITVPIDNEEIVKIKV